MAVELFLKGKISFLDIPELVGKAMENTVNKSSFTLEDIFAVDKQAREDVLSNL